MKKIKIFIGSSIDELANERNELARFIQGLNNKYIERDIFFEGYFCEESSSAMQADGSQKKHNDYIENDADAAIFMFFTKAGKFTLEELDLARKTFLEGKRPNVFVFFKAVDSTTSATDEIKKCVSKVADDYGHYFKMFDSADTIKLELLQYLVDSMPGVELKVQDGKVYLGEETIENINADNVFAYQNNSNLKKLKAQINDLLSKMTEASVRGDASEALRVSAELGEVQKTYHTLEKDILDMLKKFYEENKKGNKANPRRMEALRLLELGKVEEAKALIPQEELDRRTESLETRRNIAEKQFMDEANEIIEDALVRIESLKQDVENKNRFKEIESTYDSIYNSAQTAKRFDTICDFTCFLYDQKNYPKGIQIAEKLKYLYDDPDNTVEDKYKAELLNILGTLHFGNNNLKNSKTFYEESLKLYRHLAKTVSKSAYESDVAMTCNNLAALHQNTDRPGEAKKFYLEALEIYRRLAETVNKSKYEPDVANTCNNLATLYSDIGRMDEAEKLYLEALEIRRRLAETVSSYEYEPYVVLTCNNLANLYNDTCRTDEAEKLFAEALKICRWLVKTVSKSAYEPDMALTCNNLGELYRANGRSDEAEKLYLEALEIYRRLAETVSKTAYEPKLTVIYINLALLYENTNRLDEAEKLYLEALEIRRKLAETVDKFVYESDVAMICNNLATLHQNTDRPDSAEKFYLEALEIYRRLAETVSKSKYEPNVANTCNNLAALYSDIGRTDEAEKLYLEALEIYRWLVKTVSKSAYEPDMALTCNNLGELYRANGRSDEAEELYADALKIYRQLAETVSKNAYEPDVVMTCFILAILYNDTDRKKEAIEFFSEAGELSEKYKDVNPICRQIFEALNK